MVPLEFAHQSLVVAQQWLVPSPRSPTRLTSPLGAYALPSRYLTCAITPGHASLHRSVRSRLSTFQGLFHVFVPPSPSADSLPSSKMFRHVRSRLAPSKLFWSAVSLRSPFTRVRRSRLHLTFHLAFVCPSLVVGSDLSFPLSRSALSPSPRSPFAVRLLFVSVFPRVPVSTPPSPFTVTAHLTAPCQRPDRLCTPAPSRRRTVLRR